MVDCHAIRIPFERRDAAARGVVAALRVLDPVLYAARGSDLSGVHTDPPLRQEKVAMLTPFHLPASSPAGPFPCSPWPQQAPAFPVEAAFLGARKSVLQGGPTCQLADLRPLPRCLKLFSG